MEATCWGAYKSGYPPPTNLKVPEPKKFTFRYSIYETKATDEEDGLLGPDEFQKFIYVTQRRLRRMTLIRTPSIDGLRKAKRC
jgi:hypothetical protein